MKRRRRLRPAAATKKKRATCGGSVSANLPPLIVRHARALCRLSRASAKEARRMIAKASPGFLRCLSYVALHVLNGKLPMTRAQTERLTPYAEKVREFARNRLSASTRRAGLLKGGFLPALLGVLASTLAPTLLKGLFGGGRG